MRAVHQTSRSMPNRINFTIYPFLSCSPAPIFVPEAESPPLTIKPTSRSLLPKPTVSTVFGSKELGGCIGAVVRVVDVDFRQWSISATMAGRRRLHERHAALVV